MIEAVSSVALSISSLLFASMWEGALIAALVWIILRAFPKLSASTRYAVWLCTLAMMIAAPICTLTLSAAHQSITTTSLPPLPGPTTADLTTDGLVTLQSKVELPAPASVPERARISIPVGLSIAIAALWALVAIARSGTLAMNLRALVELRRSARHLRNAHGYPVLASSKSSVPLAFGFIDPAVVLPASMIEDVSEEALDAIVMHEVAHIRRFDVWTNALARIFQAMLALNPAAWFVISRLTIEREIACDDWVVARLDAGEIFARTLAAMACRPAFAPLAAPSAVGSKHAVVERIEKLIDRRPRTLRLSPVALVGVILAFAVIATLVPTVSPVLASSTPIAEGCGPDHPILMREQYEARGRVVMEWVPAFPLADGEKWWGANNVAIIDVSVGADGKPTAASIVSSPDAIGAVHAKDHFLRNVTYRAAMANCKAIASTQRVWYPVRSNRQRVYSIVGAVYPEGWSESHPNACRVPDLIHETPTLFIDNHTTKKLISNYRVYVDTNGNVIKGERINSTGNRAFDDATMKAAREASYPLSGASGFKPVRPSGAALAWNASHGYNAYSQCSPLPQEYIWTAVVEPAGQPYFSK